MAIKPAIDKILILAMIVFCNFIEAQERAKEGVYIKFKLSDIVYLDENATGKYVENGKIIFSFGFGSTGDVDKFLFDKRKDTAVQISFEQYESLKFSTIKELDRILKRKNMYAHPSKVFKNVYIVELTDDMSFANLYKVFWEKELFLE